MIELKSQIVVTNNFEKILNFLRERTNREFLSIIENDEFRVEDTKVVVKEAYLASNREKYIVLSAKKYNIYSQNALLKILEEPPKNIVFIILTRSKSALLPTIRSRLPVVIKREKRETNFEIDVKRVDLRYIYSFLQEHKRIEKDEAKDIIKAILKSANDRNLKLKESELDFFAKAVQLLELNSNASNVLITLFLIILEAKRR